MIWLFVSRRRIDRDSGAGAWKNDGGRHGGDRRRLQGFRNGFVRHQGLLT